MIAHLTGTVLSVGGSALVLDVGGVGYRILATPSTLATVNAGGAASLATHLVVREDSLTLYGFTSPHERDMFETLQSVQGVGPRLALALLAVHAPEALAEAIGSGDQKALQRVPGVGAKVAARLLLELGGKLTVSATQGATEEADAREQVTAALESLGWNAKQAEAAVEAVTTGPIAADDVAHTLRAALQSLGGSRG